MVTSVTPSKGSVLGGDMITMSGSNFGNGLSDVKGYVGDNVCLESSYVSESEITCLTPHGSNHPQPLFVQVGGQLGTASRANFVFVGRMIDSVTPNHMRTAGGGRVVIKSTNFVKSDFADVLIGGKRCNGHQRARDQRHQHDLAGDRHRIQIAHRPDGKGFCCWAMGDGYQHGNACKLDAWSDYRLYQRHRRACRQRLGDRRQRYICGLDGWPERSSSIERGAAFDIKLC